MFDLPLRIRYKITLIIGIGAALGLIALGYFQWRQQEQAVLAQNERTMMKLAESVIHGLQSVMLTGSADIAQHFADKLKEVPQVSEFRILRVTGEEAFRDNKTIEDVNQRRGEQLFAPREKEVLNQILPPDDANLRRAIEARQPIGIYRQTESGERVLDFYAPILNEQLCYKCHGKVNPVRGVLWMSTSLAAAERDILEARQKSLFLIAGALLLIMLATGYLLGRLVVIPIEQVTHAMARVRAGDLDQKVRHKSNDEIGRMADSFNDMTRELKTTYEGLRREQDKLTTIIYSAGEGIVITDGKQEIVLVNPAAEQLLGKTAQQMHDAGFENLFDDPQTMRRWLVVRDEGGNEPHVLQYNGHVLDVFVSTIVGGDGHVVGSAALFRDITEQKRLEEELRRLATTDGLTGLYNRRYLDETLAAEISRSRRKGAPLSIVMFDVDHFKKFNDTYGHEQGDRVLQAVAKALRDAIRKYDLPCRYGGEEFLAILPDTHAAGAFTVAERLRKDIEQMEVDGLKVTISLGVATFPDLPAQNGDELIAFADQALYDSKRLGRNRTTVASASRPAD